MLCRRQKRAGNEAGQALVEFAIILPLVIMIFFFAQWFWEVVTVKLKVQEAARYAAWEPTAFRLHNYGKGPRSLTTQWGVAQRSVVVGTMMRYADLDSARSLGGLGIWSASWTPPMVLLMNQQEELIYGGNVISAPFVNFIFKMAGQAGGAIAGMIYGMMPGGNPYSNELAGGFSGAIKDVPFGSGEWGFNSRGYSFAMVSTFVKNEWFNYSFMGKRLLPMSGIAIMERNGVLADSWNLFDGRKSVQKGTMFKQVERMYLMNKRTREKAIQLALTGPKPTAAGLGSKGAPTASGVVKSLVMGLTAIRAQLMMFNIYMPTLPDGLNPADSLFTPSVVSIPYTGGDVDSGKHEVDEDRAMPGGSQYHSSPMNKENEGALNDRGPHFMGCKEAEKLGCTHTTAQDDPFGDYLVRE